MCVCGGGGGYGLLTEKSINKFVVIESTFQINATL